MTSSRAHAVLAGAVLGGLLTAAACVGDGPVPLTPGATTNGGGVVPGDGGGGATDGGATTEGGSPALDAGSSDGGSRYRAAVLADGPIAYWRMGVKAGTTVPDETGRGNPLVLVGSDHTLGVPGVLAREDDTAIRLQGDGALTATDSRPFDFVGRKPFSLECWAKRAPPKPGSRYFQHLIGSSIGGGNTRQGYILWGVPEPAESDYARYAFDWSGGAAFFASASGPMSVVDVFVHLVASFDGTNARLSVNGVASGDPPAGDAGLGALGATFYVGSDNALEAAFDGVIDEVAVYDRALTTAEIVRHRSAALDP